MISEYELIDAVLASGASLPSPGTVLPDLQRAGGDDKAGVNDFARAISQDPAILGAVMRVANCPVFRPPRKSETVEQAIAMIGYARTLAITASVTLHSHIQLLDSNLRESVEVLFSGAQRAADLTYVLAKETNFRRFADHAYLGALMQDAGTLVLLMRSGARALEHKANDGHTALGASLMRNWKMPPLISTVVSVHHRPTEAERAGSEAFAISCLLAAGRRLRDGDSDEWQSEWASRVKETLGIGEEVLQGVMVKLIATQAE